MIQTEILRIRREEKRLRRMKRLEDYYLRLGRDKIQKFIPEKIKITWFQKFINWFKNLFNKGARKIWNKVYQMK